jgi:hypothetical protein
MRARFAITDGPGERLRRRYFRESGESYPGANLAGRSVRQAASGRFAPARAACGSANDLHSRHGESLPSLRRQSNECSRRQGYQALAREGDSHVNTDTESAPGASLDRSHKSVAPVKKRAVDAKPKAARTAKTTKASPRSSRAASSAEKLVCRYCGSDDLAPSFKKRRDARCRACFKQRYGSAPQDKETQGTRKTKAAN